MKNFSDTIIYIGKAKNLKNRVSSYFTGTKDLKTSLLLRHIHSIDYILTQSEYEALILENTLIKKHQPKYNILLKDGKTYPVIRLTNEEFPRIFSTRKIVNDGSTYFGPFTNLKNMNFYLDMIDKIFKIRKCREIPLKKRDVPCLYYHINRCSGPCLLVGKPSNNDNHIKKNYIKEIKKISSIIQGDTKFIKDLLNAQMLEFSKNLQFEKASEYRDFIKGLNELEYEQTIVQQNDNEDIDYIAMLNEDENYIFTVIQMRNNHIQGKDIITFKFYDEDSDAISQFMLQYYIHENSFPNKIYFSKPFDRELIQEYFNNKFNKNIQIFFSSDDIEKKHYMTLKMALENAHIELLKNNKKEDYKIVLNKLKETLQLKKIPINIEGYDIAHLDGTHTSASVVCFYNGKPDNSKYRIYNIRNKNNQIDDFESMREVIARRYTKAINENIPMPDLIVIDGGKGQLNAVKEILDALDLDIPICSLAKKNEEIFIPNQTHPIILPQGEDVLRLLQHIRDESHRFATKQREKRKTQEIFKSSLEGINGVGKKRSADLIKHFGSIENIAIASVEDIQNCVRISKELAEVIKSFCDVVAKNKNL